MVGGTREDGAGRVEQREHGDRGGLRVMGRRGDAERRGDGFGAVGPRLVGGHDPVDVGRGQTGVADRLGGGPQGHGER